MIFIPGNCPSSKNSKIKTSKGVFHSPTVRKYLSYIGVQKYSVRKKEVQEYKTKPNLFRESVGSYFDAIDYPLLLGFHFVRGTKHRFDIGNVQQIILDLLAAHDFIKDDDADHIIPFSFKIGGGWYSYDKQNPGVYLKMLKEEDVCLEVKVVL